MKIEGIKRQGYTMFYKVYEAGVDFEQTDDLVTLKTLERYSLHDGYRLWRVEATYSTNMKPCFYYVISPSKAVTLNKFTTIFPWLSVIMHINELSDEEAEIVLSCPAKYIVV